MKNKKGQLLGETSALLITTIVIVIIIAVFYFFAGIIPHQKAEDIKEASLAARNTVSLDALMNTKVDGIEISDMIRQKYISKDDAILRSNINSILNKLEYEYTDPITHNQRIRGYNIQISSDDESLLDYLKSIFKEIKSTNYETGFCVKFGQFCAESNINLALFDKKINIKMIESEQAKK